MVISSPYLALFLFALYDFSEGVFTPSKPTVEFETEKYFAGRLWLERLYLKCNFTPSSDTSLLYMVKWYDDAHIVYTSSLVTAANISSTYFRNENGLRVASTVSCAVFSKSGSNDPGHLSLRSEGFLVGIKTVPSPVEMVRGRMARIGLYLTVPFGCVFYYPQDKEPINCELEIIISIAKESSCDPHIMVQDGCGLRIRKREWNVTNYITLNLVDNYKYIIPLQYQITLQSRYFNYGNEWKHFQQNITISLVDDNHWKGAVCTINSHDVYMTTFNNRKFGIIHAGTYILYKNIDSEGIHTEVDVKLQSCGGDMCICGVAAMAGDDVYIIDLCGTPIYIGFTKCLNNVIDVSKNDDHNFR
ncbi:uncharacterized protein LOC134274168, partial [Saccostrea cucullata]|uniref:uncharacterized protein LOC134274168 n=1 Tax=Saccostrea cuccullata TaxID=36930 RepID=UPI002ED1213B